jgi:hypothetical protein
MNTAVNLDGKIRQARKESPLGFASIDSSRNLRQTKARLLYPGPGKLWLWLAAAISQI